MNNCQYEKIIESIQSDIREIKSDIKALLQFKWHSIGLGAGAAFCVGLFISILKIFVLGD